MALLDKYPVDVSALRKGQLITNVEMEKITGKKPTDPAKWAFSLLSVRDFIQDNTDFTVKITSDGLRILTDSEAASHNHRRFSGHIGGAKRRYDRNTMVDPTNLMPEELAIHKRNLMNESRYITALSQAGKRIAIGAHSRNTPALPQPKDGDDAKT